MTIALAGVALLALAQVDAGHRSGPSDLMTRDGGSRGEEAANGVDAVSGASVRATVDAEAGFDLLAANAVNTAAGAGSPPAELTAFELGVRARVHATAFARHAHLDLDYQGRQPVAGNSQDSTIHLLYQAELSADLLNKLLFIGVGRFLAPSAVTLPVDGLRAQLHLGHLELQVFGGRRAITSTRTGNVELTTFLPAAGGSVALAMPRLQAEVAVTFSRDQVPLLLGTAPQSFDAVSAYARAVGRPFDWLVLGGEIATAQRASYVLGPTWTSIELRARTVDLFYAVAFLELRPLKSLRVGYDFHFQKADLYREGVRLDPSDSQVTADAFTPQFIDNRLRVRWRPFELGWLGPELRIRIRPDRQEWRFGGNLDLAPDWAFGLCLRGSFTYEKMVQTGIALVPADLSYGSASLGWRWRGLDLAAGASNVQRSVLPLSGRVYTPYNDTPDKPVDLSPFVLAAERIAFLRVFYGSDLWFAGLDFEQSLTDGRERRFFVQLGARLEKEW